MADLEKVITGLECCSVKQSCSECPWMGLDCNDRLHLAALELLKEQEAKPVIVTTNAYGTRFYHCPKCSRDLYAYPRQLYCSNCGQAVKWE